MYLLDVGRVAALGREQRRLLGRRELLHADGQALLLGHDHGEIDREAVGVPQPPDRRAVELAASLGRGGRLLKELLAALQRLAERGLLLIDDLTIST